MMKKYIKINKFLILLIILSVLLYISFTYPSTLLYYYELFINCKFTYVKLLLILLVSMDIIYELITIYIINKYYYYRFYRWIIRNKDLKFVLKVKRF